LNLLTHVLTGILVQIICYSLFQFPLDLILTIIIAFLSHFIIDAFVLITYHPSEPQKGDKFWLWWQIITYSTGILTSFFFFPFVLGIIFANFVDIIDWLILRPLHELRVKTSKIDWKRNYLFHTLITIIRKKTLFWLPNWNYEKKAIITEILLDTILFLSVIYLIL